MQKLLLTFLLITSLVVIVLFLFTNKTNITTETLYPKAGKEVENHLLKIAESAIFTVNDKMMKDGKPLDFDNTKMIEQKYYIDVISPRLQKYDEVYNYSEKTGGSTYLDYTTKLSLINSGIIDANHIQIEVNESTDTKSVNGASQSEGGYSYDWLFVFTKSNEQWYMTEYKLLNVSPLFEETNKISIEDIK